MMFCRFFWFNCCCRVVSKVVLVVLIVVVLVGVVSLVKIEFSIVLINSRGGVRFLIYWMSRGFDFVLIGVGGVWFGLIRVW